MAEISQFYTRLWEVDPKNKQLLTKGACQALASEFQVSESVLGTEEFTTLAEFLALTDFYVPQLPVSINVVTESFRKLDLSRSGSINMADFAQQLTYFYDVDLAIDEGDISYEQALALVSGAKQTYKLNIYKDIFRRFGQDGDGTVSQTELGLAWRFYELESDHSSGPQRFTMQNLMEIVLEPSHIVFEREVRMNEVLKAFDWCDLDHNGVLDSMELAKAMRLAGQNPTQAEFKELKREFDVNNDGHFDFHEFVQVIAGAFISSDETREKALEAFAVFDTDSSGKITLPELKQILTTYGEDLSDEEVNALFEELHPDQDGNLEISALVELLMD